MASSALSPPLDGDKNRGWQLLAVSSIFNGISVILLFARFYTRIFIIGGVGLDDLSIALGVVSDTEESSIYVQETLTSFSLVP